MPDTAIESHDLKHYRGQGGEQQGMPGIAQPDVIMVRQPVAERQRALKGQSRHDDIVQGDDGDAGVETEHQRRQGEMTVFLVGSHLNRGRPGRLWPAAGDPGVCPIQLVAGI